MDINSLKIKTYIEDEYKLAYAKARRELGPDLVIIDKKEVKEGGLFGFFGKKKIKVTFGIEKLKGKRAEKEKEILTALRDVAKKHIPGLEEDKLSEKIVEKPTEEKKEFMPLFEKAKEEKNQAGIYSPFAKDEKKSMDDIKKELGMAFSKVEAEKSERTVIKESKKEDKSLNDLDAIKKELERELKKSSAETVTISNSDNDLIERLRDNDIPKDIAHDVVRYFSENNFDKMEMYEGLKSYFKKHIQIKKEDKHIKFIMLIGPTGVGKTTTCAKIVANNWKNEKEVGFITADTYRLEAVSQLKAYANIMRVPIEVVKKPEELNGVIEKFRDKDLVLMDTAGRSPKNREQMDELKYYVESKGDNMETVLVLSATSNLCVINETIEKFEKIGFDSIIITKLDETSRASSLLSIIKKYNYPIYYVTNGQSVPDDIEICTEEILTNIFIKGIK